MTQYKIAVVIGSLRKESFNRKLAKLAPADFGFTQLQIDDLPLYNQDDDGKPAPAVTRLKSAIAGS